MYINFRIYKFVTAIFCTFILVLFLSLTIYTKINTDNIIETNQDEVGIKVPIIMYHGISKNNNLLGNYVISYDEFESDLKYLSENNYNTIVISDLINYIEKKIPLPKNPIILTFDDGYYNNYLYAKPLLEKYNFKAIISPIIYYSEFYSKNPNNNPNYSHCTWDNLKEMMNSGTFEIQNHSYNSHKNSNNRNGIKKNSSETLDEYREFINGDVMKAQDMIKQNLNYTPIAVTYPFGATNSDTLLIVKEMGFKCTIGCEEKINYITTDSNCLYELGRFLRKSGDSLINILSKYTNK